MSKKDALGVKLTGMIQVCDGCARSKARACTFIEKRYTQDKNPDVIIFAYTTAPFPKGLIGNRYWIVLVDGYIRYD